MTRLKRTKTPARDFSSLRACKTQFFTQEVHRAMDELKDKVLFWNGERGAVWFMENMKVCPEDLEKQFEDLQEEPYLTNDELAPTIAALFQLQLKYTAEVNELLAQLRSRLIKPDLT